MQSIQSAIPEGLRSVSPSRRSEALQNAMRPGTAQDSAGQVMSSTSSSMTSRDSKTATDALWVSMLSMFGHKWASQNGTVPNGSNSDAWSAALFQLSPSQIAAGMTEVAQSGMKWPPSAPEFRAMCFGLPSLARVRIECRPGAECSQFTMMVKSKLDWHRYQGETQDAIADRLLADAYAIAREDVLKGVPLPEKPAALIGFEKRRRPVPASRRVVGEQLAKIASILGGA